MAERDRTAASNDIDPLADSVELSEEELALRKQFLEFGDEDIKRLTGIGDLARRYADAAYFDDPQLLERVKGMQKEYFLRLTQGNYDLD